MYKSPIDLICTNDGKVLLDWKRCTIKMRCNDEWIELAPVRYAEWLVPDEHYPDTCSSCKFEFVWDGDDDYLPKFCPECGAAMGGRKLLYK